MPAFNDIVSQMRAALAATDPDLDTSTGTTTRKILDAVAESVAESYLDQHMLSYQYDIDSKVGADLDSFCQLFGITRFGAKRATGTVVFSREPTDINTTILIPVNTVVGTSTSPQISVITVVPSFMDIGIRTVTVPVQTIDGGSQGNVGAGTLTILLSPMQGISQVTNIVALSGGASQETDAQLRLRWKQTAFRNIAGSEQFYLGLATADGLKFDPGCDNANVIGGSKTHREQIQISSGIAQSQADDVVFSYPTSAVVGTDIDAGDVLIRDHDYTFDTTTTPPTVRKITGGSMVEGDIYDLVYEYIPVDSRNDGTNGITNRIDVWCNGIRPVGSVQSVIFQNSKRFLATPTTDPLYFKNFVRPNGTHAATYGPDTLGKSNVFIPLAWGPIVTLPASLVVGANTYLQATPDNLIGTVIGPDIYAYSMVHQDGPFGWTPLSGFGIEWDADYLPANGTPFVVGEAQISDGSVVSGYSYNDVPRAIQASIDNWRLVGTDAKAHQAKLQYLRFSLAVILDPRASRSVAFTQIEQALSNYCAALSFDSTVQVGEALRAVLNAPAVTNARFLSANDFSGPWTYSTRNNFTTGIQRIIEGVVVETYLDTNGRLEDVTFGDAELVAFDSLAGGNTGEPSVRAQNSFGSS